MFRSLILIPKTPVKADETNTNKLGNLKFRVVQDKENEVYDTAVNPSSVSYQNIGYSEPLVIQTINDEPYRVYKKKIEFSFSNLPGFLFTYETNVENKETFIQILIRNGIISESQSETETLNPINPINVEESSGGRKKQNKRKQSKKRKQTTNKKRKQTKKRK